MSARPQSPHPSTRTHDRARTRTHAAPALALGLGLLWVAACGGGGKFQTDTIDPGGDPTAGVPGQLLDAQGGGDPLTVDLPGRLSVLLQVKSAGGSPIAGLTADNFRLFEDGQLVSATESRQRLLPKPRVFRSYSLLLLDLSGSVAGTPAGVQAEVAAAKAYIDVVTQNPENHVAVAWFFGGVSIQPALLDDLSPLGFTNDAALLNEAVENVDLIQVTSTSTNLYGAIVDGLDTLDVARGQAQTEGIEFTSLTLVTFTDGTDQAGLVSAETAAARFDTDVYDGFTIGLGAEIDQGVLQTFGPDGSAFAADLDDLSPSFAGVAQGVSDLANSFYLVAYISPKIHGSGTHQLEVRAVAGGGSASRTYDFDASYFSGGAAFVDSAELPRPEDRREAVDLGPLDQGRTLVLGHAEDGTGGLARRLWVQRRTMLGNPDPAYGTYGWRVLETVAGDDHLTPAALAVLPDGAALVALTARDADTDPQPRVAVVRVDAGGALGPAQVLDPPNGGGATAVAATLAPDGDLLVLGRESGGTTALWRLDPETLQPVPTFGTGGRVLFPAGATSGTQEPTDLCVRADGRLLVCGRAHNPTLGAVDLQVVGFTADGALDTAFANAGVLRNHGVFQSFAPGGAEAIGVDGLGRVVIAGRVQAAPGLTHPTVAFWRTSPAGVPDPGFTGNAGNPYLGTGLVTLAGVLTGDANVLFGLESRANDLVVRDDGSLLALGWRDNAEGHRDLCTWRLSAAGFLVGSYNGTGFVVDDGAGGEDSVDEGRALAITPDGRVQVVGTSAPAGEPARALLWEDDEPTRTFQPHGLQ